MYDMLLPQTQKMFDSFKIPSMFQPSYVCLMITHQSPKIIGFTTRYLRLKCYGFQTPTHVRKLLLHLGVVVNLLLNICYKKAE